MKSTISLPPRRLRLLLSLLTAGLALATGCGHKQRATQPPPPPPPPSISAAPEPAPVPPSVSPRRPVQPSPSLSSDEEYVATHRPIYSETGMASWYGPPYNKRRAADGRVYNEDGISAAHRTLPMGSLIRVTNLRTGQSAVMRVTDRGPFVPGRILDLSLGAAKEVGVWRPGTARVRVDVYSTPQPIDEGGRWCVQVGAFTHKGAALHLQSQLERRYRSANVIEFQGPTGYWVRIRPAHDDHAAALALSRQLHPAEGEAWLVRLD